MSLLSVLKAVGKDLSHVGGWIDDALKIVEPIVGVLDPPLAIIITDIEEILDALPTGSKAMNASGIQAIVLAVTTLVGLRSAPAVVQVVASSPVTVVK